MSREPGAERITVGSFLGSLVHHCGELGSIVGEQLRGDHEQRRAVRQLLEPRAQHIGQAGGEGRLPPEPGLGHVAHDHLELRARDELAHRLPFAFGHERARDRPDQPRPLDRGAVLQAALHEREQAVLGVHRAGVALRRALHDHDPAVERARPVGGVNGRRAQGAQ